MKQFNRCSLKPYNTFSIDAEANKLIILEEEVELNQLSSLFKSKEPRLILGGGSNILLTKDFEGNVIAPWFKGIEILEENANSIYIRVAAGVVWDDFVGWACMRDYWGIENLSLIPGHVGASPIQNIGAYGVEVKDAIESVTFFNLERQIFQTLTNQECQFGYRNSIFKQVLKGNIIVSSVTFKLSKIESPILHYANLKEIAGKSPSPIIIRNAVIGIRKSKLPDPKITGNAGSFFKNPIINERQFHDLKITYPDIPSYPNEEGNVKIPAGWLIEQGGWKGKTTGKVGVHPKQALVIVNYGGATGSEVISFAKDIQCSISKHFGIALEMEVNAI
jgi:UDP-N-acetylenolpyruvoylglucosamine reductase